MRLAYYYHSDHSPQWPPLLFAKLSIIELFGRSENWLCSLGFILFNVKLHLLKTYPKDRVVSAAGVYLHGNFYAVAHSARLYYESGVAFRQLDESPVLSTSRPARSTTLHSMNQFHQQRRIISIF